jgi:hypothetical protein
VEFKFIPRGARDFALQAGAGKALNHFSGGSVIRLGIGESIKYLQPYAQGQIPEIANAKSKAQRAGNSGPPDWSLGQPVHQWHMQVDFDGPPFSGKDMQADAPGCGYSSYFTAECRQVGNVLYDLVREDYIEGLVIERVR